tara:strand:- start:19413 stop:20303 length:891 start_codon:yes stop_codon:yes gene_type:complete
MGISISIIIVNYNSGEFLRDCINSLFPSPIEMEVIVVDNASSDGSLNTIDAMPQVTIIPNDKNLGFSTGCNIGIKASSANYLLFLNPDCTVSRDTIMQLLDYLQAHDQAGMVGGLLVYPDGTEQGGGRRSIPTPWRTLVRALGLTRFSNRWPNLFTDFHLHKQPLPTEPVEVEAISGACMLIKRKALDDVGLWDEGYFLHCEDLDYCMRFRKNGWKIMFLPQAKVVHEHGACSKSRPFFVEWHKHKGMLRFYRKFFRQQYPHVLWCGVVFGVWFRFVVVSSYHLVKLTLAKTGLTK